MKYRATVALSLAAFVFALGASALAANVKLLETGSTLVYPLMNLWVKTYQSVSPGVQITTQGTGSGTGISQAIAGVAQIGASDAYVSDSQMQKASVLNIPLAISAQQINYNLPELRSKHLNLSGAVLAGIYDGTIHNWNDPKIVAINRDMASKLPNKAIIPIRRSDGSGDTFIFTQYLSDTAPSWKSGPGFGTTISWPAVQNEVGATGNPGMISACKGAPYSIAYIGISFIAQTNSAGLGYAALQNKSGKFVLPTAATIKAAAAALVGKTPSDERISLIDAQGADAYPIINYEYAVVNPKQPDADTAAALRKFLTWAISKDGGNKASFLDQVHFIALPARVAEKSKDQIAKIQ
ncbi:MAG: phosphate ABC transporter substrate-binding protein PstS [Candidatus Eremiobacteraeota bacterium]|nr:phosphate ABC transporter substrate-binding protein PstS [Candidatus Eremiobacteraeota bacterium]